MIEMLEYQFMQNAIIAAFLVGIGCGVVGTFVVLKRLVFISGGIAHAAFGGVGLGLFLGINPILTAIPFSIVSAIGIGVARNKIKITEDSAIGILWSMGMALGILFIGLTPGYTPDLFSFLFGSILTVPTSDIYLMLVLDVLIIGLVIFFFKELRAISFDEEFSKIAGLPVNILYILLLCMVALSIIMMIRVVGIILVIALLTIPTVISRQYFSKLPSIMIFSVVFAVIPSIIGLILSYFYDLASGATIVLILGLTFILSTLIKFVRKR